MKNDKKKNKKNTGIGKVLFSLGLLVLIFISLSKLFNVYQIAWVGAIFEFLWLPIILLLFIIPILSFIYWAQQKFKPNSLYLFTMLISIISIILMVFLK